MSHLFNWQLTWLRDGHAEANTLDEWATQNFWRHVFSYIFSTSDNYMVYTESPPMVVDSARRVDLMVRRAGGQNLSEVLLWAEAKSISAKELEIAGAESQGYTAAYEHLLFERSGRTAVWVMTVVGPSARLWAYAKEKDDPNKQEQGMLTPIFPTNGDYGKWHRYLNLYGNESVFEWIFDFIRQHEKPTDDFVNNYIHGRIPGILIDTENTMEVTVLGAREQEQDLLCALVHGGSLKALPAPADWFESFYLHQNTRLRCFHYYETVDGDIEQYWTRDLDLFPS